MMHHSAEGLLIVLALVGPGTRVRAQDIASPCPTAIVQAKKLVSASVRGRSEAIDRLASCGPEGAAAVGDVFRNARASRDTAFLGQLVSYAAGANGMVLVEPLLAVADDRQASAEARVEAMLGLLRLQTGRSDIRYWDVTGGLDRTGPIHGCGAGRNSTDQAEAPRLAAADVARIIAMAKRIRRDSSAPVDVQTAAACLNG